MSKLRRFVLTSPAGCLSVMRVWTNQFMWEWSCLSQCEEKPSCVGGSVRGSPELNEVTKVIVTSNLFKTSTIVVLSSFVVWRSRLFNVYYLLFILFPDFRSSKCNLKMKPNFKFRNTCYVESLKYGWKVEQQAATQICDKRWLHKKKGNIRI